MSTEPVDRSRRLEARWKPARPLAFVGSANVIGGGLVAAVTHPTGFELGSWTAAYLVLVGGVAQIALGAAQAWLAQDPPRVRVVVAEGVAWNLSTGLVVGGTLAALPVLTTVGGVILMACLVGFLCLERLEHSTRLGGSSPTWATGLYRGLIVFVLLSAPVGLVLAWVRRG